MPQANIFIPFVNSSGTQKPALIDGNKVQVVGSGTSSALNLTAATVVKATAGRLVKVNVIVAGTAAGTANDCATTGAVAAANEVFVIPNTVGTYNLDWPCLTGITITPGTGQTVAVSYI